VRTEHALDSTGRDQKVAVQARYVAARRMSRHEIVEIAVHEVLDPIIRGQQVVLGAEEQSLPRHVA
jgi:hypothetical protein